jgi:hypothetical protein
VCLGLGVPPAHKKRRTERKSGEAFIYLFMYPMTKREGCMVTVVYCSINSTFQGALRWFLLKKTRKWCTLSIIIVRFVADQVAPCLPSPVEIVPSTPTLFTVMYASFFLLFFFFLKKIMLKYEK